MMEDLSTNQSEMEIDDSAPPLKRRRLSGATELDKSSSYATNPLQQNTGPSTGDDLAKEVKAGITSFVNPNALGFSGVLKQRYTDFLVNEVLPDGHVLHLSNLAPPKRKRQQEERATEVETTSSGAVNQKDEIQVNNPASHNADNNQESQHAGTSAPAEEVNDSISEDDQASLEAIFGANTVKAIRSLYGAILKHPDRKRKDFRSIASDSISDKEIRTKAHQTIRKVFSSKLDSTTEDDNTIKISAAGPAAKERGGNFNSNATRVRGRIGWEELGGDYLHFTLHKENKDTMEVVSFLASQLKVGAKNFQFGGTKDRRGVTVQRVSVYRVHAEQMAAVGRQLRGSKVGDFQYKREGLELGELGGNEFVITLRDCHFPGKDEPNLERRLETARTVVQEAVESFRHGGYLNYYGLQRFGTFAASTDLVGTKLLQGDLKGAIDCILDFSPMTLAAAQADPPNGNFSASNHEPGEKTHTLQTKLAGGASIPLISSDDRARALAIDTWQKTRDSNAAIALLPRKFSAETNIIRHLGQRNRKTGDLDRMNDYQGALQTIPRNLRLMYVHAYQSLVWNVIAGIRWEKYGSQVIEGDLVLVQAQPSSAGTNGAQEERDGYRHAVDEAGEALILPTPTATAFGSDGTSSAGLSSRDPFQRARPLSAEEAASGFFTIFDVVLPLPGFDVLYPSNAIGEEYKVFMASERGGGLDPHNMRRSWKDLSLSGGYRKLLSQAVGLSAEVKTYRGDEQLVETDLERLEKKTNATTRQGQGVLKDGTPSSDAEELKIAVVLRMQLGPSQYATMALRELMKEGGVRTYKPEYGGR